MINFNSRIFVYDDNGNSISHLGSWTKRDTSIPEFLLFDNSSGFPTEFIYVYYQVQGSSVYYISKFYTINQDGSYADRLILNTRIRAMTPDLTRIGLTASRVLQNEITLQLAMSVNMANIIDYFVIMRNDQVIADKVRNVRSFSYTDKNLNPRTSYKYRVIAYDIDGVPTSSSRYNRVVGETNDFVVETLG